MPLTLAVRSLVALVFVVATCFSAVAQALLPVRALSAHVIDQTATLDSAQRDALEARLVELEQREGTQLVVLIVQSTAPEDIAAFANRVGSAWKIGRPEVGDGLIVVVAKGDRTMRIEVAKALEGAIPDLAAARIIDHAMAPRFREGDFAGGLNAAVDQLAARIAGEPLPEPSPTGVASDADSSDFGAALLFGVLAIGQLMGSLFGRRVGALLLGAGTGAVVWLIGAGWPITVAAAIAAALYVLLAAGRGAGAWSSGSQGSSRSNSDWHWSGGNSGGSGGGFSSGGGGSFGGGGASGRW